MIRILVVDDHPVVREGLVALLGDEPDFVVTGQATTAGEGLAEAVRLRPDVVVMDVRLPDRTGVEVCGDLARQIPSVRVVMLTSFPNDGVMMASFAAGARGFVLKESQPAIIRQAVRTVSEGGTYADPKVAGKLVALATRGRRAKGPFDLTVQEMRVLELLPRGLTNNEIGERLGIGENTVKTHLRNLMRKLDARDRVEAAAIAMREGLA
ncbi:MAG TPA: response regulator transcription factor [Actinomycetota bacterium]|nr:response regulator transcription factor [Actinomycetota bacterium]